MRMLTEDVHLCNLILFESQMGNNSHLLPSLMRLVRPRTKRLGHTMPKNSHEAFKDIAEPAILMKSPRSLYHKHKRLPTISRLFRWIPRFPRGLTEIHQIASALQTSKIAQTDSF